jgi:hypothetical protein
MSALVCTAALLLVASMLVRLTRRATMNFLVEISEVLYPARPATFLVSRYPKFAESDLGPDQLSYDETGTEVTTVQCADGTGVASGLEATSRPRRRAVSMDIRTFLQSRVPSLYQEFSPTWWLPSGHFQTAYVALGDFSKIDLIDYAR